ncbi:FUSC family protein [Bacillus sp. Marseille-P3661]|uniref:FUSC family protein n=1 Tax=Bacillus sp. Marseille-P3661 TaxID=1936234 RepID=UPI0015E17A51|nr:aromatic acid exporter family protein [Bacillus sp. Marseille-P3661]
MDKLLKSFLFGGRVLKTGIAVFITAILCQLFNLPTIFAVITAIVTIEPTATDSIKKGIIRFPASAIGAALSMLLVSFLGEQPLTYALATILTIYFCHKLKLEDGIVVATITAAAMIPATTDHFLLAFIARLGTTTIGIVVSTIVNIIILPPKFSHLIDKNIADMFELKAEILEQHLKQLGTYSSKRKQTIASLYAKLGQLIVRTNKLCYYEREEFKYHKQNPKDIRMFHYTNKRLNVLQLIAFHLGNLNYLENKKLDFSKTQKDVLCSTILSLIEILKKPEHQIPVEHHQIIEQVDRIFRSWKESGQQPVQGKYYHHFQPETTFLYEILSIHDALEELEQLAHTNIKLQDLRN